MFVPMSATAGGQTPGLYAYPESYAAGRTAAFSTTVGLKPSKDAHVFWSHQFKYGSGSGYIGFQTTEDAEGRNLWLFSVWGATGCRPTGSDGSYCVHDTDGAAGASVRIWKTWQAGTTYTLKIAPAVDESGWWRASMVDGPGGTETAIGDLQFGTPDTRLSPVSSWVEYFNWNNPAATCWEQEDSDVTFGPMEIDGVSVGYQNLRTSSTCSTGNVLGITRDGSAYLSARPALERTALVPLEADALALAPNFRFWGSGVRLQNVELDRARGWSRRPDGSIRTSNGWCLANQSATFWHHNRVLLTRCAGDANERWDVTNGRYQNRSTGLCLTISGPEARPGESVSTAACSDDRDQQFAAVQPQSIASQSTGGYLTANPDGVPEWGVETSPSIASLDWRSMPDGTIRNEDTTRCLDLTASSTAHGTPAILWPCNGRANQKWTITAEGEIRTSLTENVCLVTEVDGRIVAGACDGTAEQKFWFSAPRSDD